MGKNTAKSNTDNSEGSAIEGNTEGNTIDTLYRLILQRKETPREHSYTCSLFSRGKDEILKKFGEEAVEVIIAAKGQGRQRLIEELSDLCYHALVLMADEGISPEDISLELNNRSEGRKCPP